MKNDDDFQKRISLKKPARSYEVGEQKVSNYDLPTDGKDHRFGKPSGNSDIGVSNCLQYEYLNSIKKAPQQTNQDDDYRITKIKDTKLTYWAEWIPR